MSRGTLSVCMIVRNEAQLLADCLDSVAEISDQLVIVDTGSTDDTVTIATSYGAQVHHFDWIDDFSAARNESIRHASGDWILWIDADELLVPSSAEVLRRLTVKPAKRPTIYQVWIRNLQKDKESYTLSMSHRLFSRHPGLHFAGRIHEQIFPSLRNVNGVEKRSEVVLDHQGYALDSVEWEAKLHRNQTLLEAMVEEQPDSSYAHYTLGQNYALLGVHERALGAYQQALAIGDFKGSSASTLLNGMAESCWKMNRLDEAEAYAMESLTLTRQQTSGNFIMYRIMRSRNDVKGQINYLERILPLSIQAKARGVSDLPKDVLIPPQHLYYSLSMLYSVNGDVSVAEDAVRKCLAIEPARKEARELLVSILAQQNCWEELLKAAKDIPSPLPERIRELAGVALIKLDRFEEAIDHYRVWLAECPDHEPLRKRLAGLYAKVGNRTAAQRLLEGGWPS